MDLNTLKLGGGMIDADRWNKLVDEVLGEGESTYWYKEGSGSVNVETYNRLADKVGGSHHTGSGSVPPEVYNALIDHIVGEPAPV